MCVCAVYGRACVQGSIYGFDAGTGVAKMTFQHLHLMPITSMIYAPSSDTVMTVTLDEGVTVGTVAHTCTRTHVHAQIHTCTHTHGRLTMARGASGLQAASL